MVSAQCRLVQSMWLGRNPDPKHRNVVVLSRAGENMRNLAPGRISQVFIKTLYIQLCFPAPPRSICMTLGKSLFWLGCRLQRSVAVTVNRLDSVPKAMGAGVFLQPDSPGLSEE